MKRSQLEQLGALKAALDKQRIDAQAALARQREIHECAEHERLLFSRSVGAVQTLPERGRADLRRASAPPVPRQRLLDERAALREALSDEVDVDSLLDTDEALSFRRDHIGTDVPRRLRRGEWAVQAELDLHGLRRDAARDSLASFIREATHAGLRCVRVVHGKGHGSPGREPVLKAKVHAWLVQKQEVLVFVQARAAQGGSGALVVLLTGES